MKIVKFENDKYGIQKPKFLFIFGGKYLWLNYPEHSLRLSDRSFRYCQGSWEKVSFVYERLTGKIANKPEEEQ